jgi:hypothetical protein
VNHIKKYLNGLKVWQKKRKKIIIPDEIMAVDDGIFRIHLLVFIKRNILFVLDRVVLAHAITVIQHNYVITEEEVVVMVVERVVQQVDIIIINNNGMDPIMVVPVVIRGLVIIKLVVVMIVSNNKLVPVMVIVNRIKVGGTVHHETKTKIK